MNICIECNMNKIKTVLRCDVCDDKLNERIKIKMLMSYNWPFENNNVLSYGQRRTWTGRWRGALT